LTSAASNSSEQVSFQSERSAVTAIVTLPGKPKLSDDFHIYASEWSPDTVKFFIDTTLYETRTPKDMPAGGTWVFNHPFFITLNLAIGGVFDGDPLPTHHFPLSSWSTTCACTQRSSGSGDKLRAQSDTWIEVRRNKRYPMPLILTWRGY
jgi:beta-glucanase (GH16 family)